LTVIDRIREKRSPQWNAIAFASRIVCWYWQCRILDRARQSSP